MASKLPYRSSEDGVRLNIKLKPNGGRPCFRGIVEDADGVAWIRARVTPPPEKGRANAALIELIARTLHVPKISIKIIKGENDSYKVLEVRGSPPYMTARAEWLVEEISDDDD